MAGPTTDVIAARLEPFGLCLSPDELRGVQTYLELLLRWNRHINLTSVRGPEAIVTRHFGESLYLTRVLELDNRFLVDVGTGAGFPGLALKLLVPRLRVMLVEALGKKVVFLKEVIRTLRFAEVEVVQGRFEDVVRNWRGEPAQIVTARAVGDHLALLRGAARILAAGGAVVVYLGRRDAESLVRGEKLFTWQDCRLLPGAKERVILLGRKV